MRALLLERDFDEIATEDILARAEVSRGGLYHHFPSKIDLFGAAYEASERDMLGRLASVVEEQEQRGAGPFDQLVSGCLAYLQECATGRELPRIGLRQSRSVLGWERWREAARPLGIAVMRMGIQTAADAGELSIVDVDVTTHLVLAALIEAGLLVATDPEPVQALVRIKPEIVRLLNGLRAAR